MSLTCLPRSDQVCRGGRGPCWSLQLAILVVSANGVSLLGSVGIFPLSCSADFGSWTRRLSHVAAETPKVDQTNRSFWTTVANYHCIKPHSIWNSKIGVSCNHQSSYQKKIVRTIYVTNYICNNLQEITYSYFTLPNKLTGMLVKTVTSPKPQFERHDTIFLV